MTPELWSRITDIFDAALDCPPGERESFVERASAGDPVLRAGVARLLEEFDRAGNFLEEPVSTPVRVLSAGEIVAGRYRVEALLGRGGMGEVYRAHDEFVDEPLALKTLRPELATDIEFVRRFRREVQLSRRVTHPDVCRVFDVGIHTDASRRPLHFYTMELLTGETLSQRIRRAGPLSEEAAYLLAVQLAAGLDAAHVAGIIHRDFKSANVMLCGRGAVITDFGLARYALAGSSGATTGTITVHPQIAGTIAYMSPEQLAGEPLTVASDIYSLGIVLFEMVAGRLPFDETHIVQSAMQRAAEEAPDVRRLAPGISPAWAAVITRCLQRDPGRRYSSAPSVAKALQPRWRPPMAYWNRRQWLKAAAAGTASVAGMAAAPALLRFYSADAVLPEGARVLIGTISNTTGDEQFDATTELLRTQLTQSVRTSLIDGREVSSVLRQMQKPDDTSDSFALREAAWRLNAVLAIYGTLSRVGADYALSLQLETRGSQPDNPRGKWLRSFSASDPAGLMRAVREASVWIRETVGESTATIATFDRLPENATTPSWEALKFYARGQQHFMKNDLYGALDQFEYALDRDADFTLVRMRKADLLSTQYRHAEAIRQWKHAIAGLSKRTVTRAEELYGQGMYSLDGGDLEEADLHFRTWAREYPNDWRPRFYRMIPLCMSGHAAHALDLLKGLQPRMPEYGDLYVQMIGCHLVLGQVAEARALIPTATRLNRPERAGLREAYLSFLEGDAVSYLEALRAIVRDVLAQPIDTRYLRGAFDAVRQEALLLIDVGQPARAATRIDEFLAALDDKDLMPQRSVLNIIQAWAEMLSGESAKAIGRAKRAMDEEPGPVKVALAGTLFARLRHAAFTNDALNHCADQQDIPLYRQAQHRILGEMALAAGRPDVGLNELRSAAALEPPLAHRPFLIEALPPNSPERLELSRNVVRHPWQFLRPPPLHCIGSLRTAVPDVLAAGDDNEFAKRFAESSRRLIALA